MGEIPLSQMGLFTLAEAAAYLGKHERTIRRWVREGLTHVPVGGNGRAGYFLFRRADLDAWRPPRVGAPDGNQNAKKKPAPRPKKTRRSRDSGK